MIQDSKLSLNQNSVTGTRLAPQEYFIFIVEYTLLKNWSTCDFCNGDRAMVLRTIAPLRFK